MDCFVRHEKTEATDRKPIKTEFDFGTEEEPFILELAGRQIRLTGRFDRVDEYTGGDVANLVIDYKRSGGAARFRECVRGHAFQLPIYILAAAEMLKTDISAVRATFYSFRDAKLSSQLNPKKSDSNGDWSYYFSLSDTTTDKYKKEPPARKLNDILEEIVKEVRGGTK